MSAKQNIIVERMKLSQITKQGEESLVLTDKILDLGLRNSGTTRSDCSPDGKELSVCRRVTAGTKSKADDGNLPYERIQSTLSDLTSLFRRIVSPLHHFVECVSMNIAFTITRKSVTVDNYLGGRPFSLEPGCCRRALSGVRCTGRTCGVYVDISMCGALGRILVSNLLDLIVYRVGINMYHIMEEEGVV